MSELRKYLEARPWANIRGEWEVLCCLKDTKWMLFIGL